MIRLGAVTIDTSHPLAFAKYFAIEKKAEYVAVYNDSFRTDAEVQGFMKKTNTETRCNTLEEMVDLVDIAMIHSCNWDKHIEYAMPFIKKGKPVFIDKPIVGSLADCEKIEQLVQDGAVILGSSSARYCDDIVEFLAIPAKERGEILSIYGTSGVDEYNYGIHIVEAISEIVGCDGDFSKYVGSTSIEGKTCETYFVKYVNGITATYNLFFGTWQPFEIVIMTTKTTYQFRIDTTKIYNPMLNQICDFISTGNNKFASIKKLTDSVKIMLAGRISKENDGLEIKVCEIPKDDKGFDGDQFAKDYEKIAPNLYLD